MKKVKHRSRRDFLIKMSLMPFTLSSVHFPEPVIHNKATSIIERTKKIDCHIHISSDADYLREIMDSLNMKMYTICNEGLKTDRLKMQVDTAMDLYKKYPRYYGWCTTFGFDGMNEPDWPERVIDYLDNCFGNGASAVKIWKEVGMELKNQEGKFVQIDDPVFEPILNHLSEKKIPLFLHSGDPVEYWLSTGIDGKRNAWYYEGAGYLNRIGEFRGEVSYNDLILARNRMMDNFKDLKVIGCHLGSMAFDTDIIANHFDRYPNFSVDTSSAINYLMGQSSEKVRAFMIKYQDRILYGSDSYGGRIATPWLIDMSKANTFWTADELLKEKNRLLKLYNDEFMYYSCGEKIQRNGYSINGLALPEDVIEKIFYTNAVNWIPGINKSF
jgi:predicted TIM-barrel fold metal-dependent hydrolase